MGYSLKTILRMVCAAPLLLGAISAFAQTQRELRSLSFSVRDRPPSIDEAKQHYNQEKTLDELLTLWLASSEHDERIYRYFNDMFGVEKNQFQLEEEFILKDNGSGVLQFDATTGKAGCTAGQAVSSSAWWLNSGQTVSVCPNIVSNVIAQSISGTWVACSYLGANGISNANCGCGPNLILCIPNSLRYDLDRGLRKEFPNRAQYGYKNQWSWLDVFGGAKFYGSRVMFQHYLFKERIRGYGAAPSAAELAALASLPLTTSAVIDFPSSMQRSGIVTMPSFMRLYNNFRSRLRAMTERLLCQDVTPGLNTDNRRSFANTHDLSAADIARGNLSGCSDCHYPLDNMGSIISRWEMGGEISGWNSPTFVGHVFGQTGTGAKFLMQGFIERGPGFQQCMAKRAWEDFSGQDWSVLSESEQNKFTAAAASGPYNTIRTILQSSEIRAKRSAYKVIVGTKEEAVNLDFNADINPILEKSCGGASCHSSGTSLGNNFVFIGKESRFKSIDASRLIDGSMPPPSSGKSINSQDRSALYHFVVGE